ncbi:hypothetical protein [Microbacterium sp. YY-01]|uniref:hypothetical protein n=1 Tax=Microbacterium sp. YY-01 TaxID=3421634 RepID=UPI003D16558F
MFIVLEGREPLFDLFDAVPRHPTDPDERGHFFSARHLDRGLLKKKLAEHDLFQPGFTGMTADSSFPALVSYWLEDMDPRRPTLQDDEAAL